MKSNSSLGIKIIVWVNGLAALLHLLFWTFALVKLPAISSVAQISAKTNLATTYGFGIADLVWSVPLLTLGSVGLWRRHTSGWLAAHMANVLYWYSFTVIIIRDLFSNAISPGTMLFMPFALFSFWATFYLWKVRSEFLVSKSIESKF